MTYDKNALEPVSGSQKIPNGFGTCNFKVAGKAKLMSTKLGTIDGDDVLLFEVTVKVKDGASGSYELGLCFDDSADSFFTYSGGEFTEIPSAFETFALTVVK